MKMFIFPCKKYCWSNKAGREAIGALPNQPIRISYKGKQVERDIRPAPVAAARVLRGVEAAAHLYGLAVTKHDMELLGVKTGTMVDVISLIVDTSIEHTPQRLISNGATTNRGPTLHELMEQHLVDEGEVGSQLGELSESAVKSRVYSIAKELGIKIKKVDANTIERVE
jgi:hypothetical protein